jgi:predicted transcriptional regulator
MVSEAEIRTLRLEADTILTRYDEVETALERARHGDGDHWEAGELTLTLETPSGDPIEVCVDLEADPDESARKRYDKASELEAELDRERSVDDQLAILPADPVAYRICYHLDDVEGDYPKSIAGHLRADRGHVEDRCEEMEAAGILERVESGTVKQRRVKAKMADEVRQHHTYYRTSRQGDHLLRFLEDRDGRRNVLLHLPDGRRVADHLQREGAASPRGTAEALEMEFEYARHHCRTLQRVGLARTVDPNSYGVDADAAGGKYGYYAVTALAEDLLEETG